MAKKTTENAKIQMNVIQNAIHITEAPTGLTIARDGMKFTCSWKIKDKDYGQGQQFEWRINDDGKWHSVTVGKKTTSKVVTLDASTYYPNKKKKITSFYFQVRGRRSNYSTKTKLSGNTITTNFEPNWSAWSAKGFSFNAPAKPSVSATWGGTGNPYGTTFSWTSAVTASDHKVFSEYVWQTILVQNCNETDGSKLTWNSKTTGWNTGTGGAGSRLITENSAAIVGIDKSYTRWFRVMAKGPGGDSQWAYAKHVYSTPQASTIHGVQTSVDNNVTAVVATWTAPASAANPVDKTEVQWRIDIPAAGCTCPNNDDWETAITPVDTAGKDKARFHIESKVDFDQCLWTRIRTQHDTNYGYSTPVRVTTGRLTKPDGLSVQTNSTTYRATITCNNNSAVPDSNIAVIFRTANNANNDLIVGVIPHGSEDTGITVQCPDWSNSGAVSFGIYAFQGTYSKKTRADGVSQYTISANMTSETTFDGGSVPLAPTNVTVESSTDTSGEIIITWAWAWNKADITEISWSQNPNAWESTDDPETYEVTNLHAAKWRISGLETGVTWYIRLRLGKRNGDETTYGPYCEAVSIDLSSAPLIPVLTLSEGVITAQGSVTALWAYVTTDGTNQAYAEICEATVNSSGITYGRVIAHTESAQHILRSARALRWTAGHTYNLCVRVVSASGHVSDGWSAPVPVTVAEEISCTITGTSLIPVTEDGTAVNVLDSMPLTVNVVGAGSGGMTSVTIERAEDYSITRPDEGKGRGYEGETIANVRINGEGSISIDQEDLRGSLDDGAPYRIVTDVMDGLGQTAQASMEFEVRWAHQALMPDAEIRIDDEKAVAYITPTAPAGVEEGDVCDIYRLSADRPELIVKDGAWGTKYVDPYPALGGFGGHRVVYKTINGDYITAENQVAWADFGADEGDILEYQTAIIDFGGDSIELEYNISLSNSWKKDFEETTYLGGSVQGDWNPGVSRTLNMNGVMIISEDPEQIRAMRRLAVHAGICHVRTPDGSSFAADVQVNENLSYDKGGNVASFTLNITRVDPESLDGMTYEEWFTEDME